MRRIAAVIPLVIAAVVSTAALSACGRDQSDAVAAADPAGAHDVATEHSPAPATPAPAPVIAVAVLNCQRQPEIRPAAIILTCADRNMIIDRIRWDSWTDSGASGRGMESRSVCHPDCASAPRQSFPVTVELTMPADGVFTTLTKTPDGGAPEVLPLSG
ncbi:hypothetical protein [Nocardia goodfellowii]|uniref:Lipoprotein n=1 Tax=Nocardia goodfellowii TaxID=882446 RepID=A0ABS4QCW8_9NOCA|nr:hypothetical protein [Nocardia goodfellowii]MBP2189535.1 hypothetical protein [Nocardia goodfellowii]